MFPVQTHEADKAQQNVNAVHEALLQILAKLGLDWQEPMPIPLRQPGSFLRAALEPRSLPQLNGGAVSDAIAGWDHPRPPLPGTPPIQIQIGETRLAGTLEAVNDQLAALPASTLLYLRDALNRPALPAASDQAKESPDIDRGDIETDIKTDIETDIEVIAVEVVSVEIDGELQFYQNDQGEITINQLPEDASDRSSVQGVSLAQGDERMRIGEQLTHQDQVAVETLKQIFERPELQNINAFEGRRFSVERAGDRVSVFAKDGRGEILSIEGQHVRSRLEPQDFAAFSNAQQLLQKTPVWGQSTPLRDAGIEMTD